MPKRKLSADLDWGGARQRVAWANAGASSQPSTSSTVQNPRLGRLLLSERAWGGMTTPQIQKIAMAALDDGAKGDDLHIIASLGANGRFPANMERDLEARLKPSPFSSCIAHIALPFKSNFQIKWTDTSVLLPHEVFATLFSLHPAKFIESLLGSSVSRTTNFWAAMKGHPSMEYHPELRDQAIASKTIPISLHGDAVPVAGIGKSWSKSVEIVSWRSMLTTGTTLTTTFLVFLWHMKLCSTMPERNTLDVFWRRLVWSLTWLQKGKWPDRNEHGVLYHPTSPEGKKARENGGWLASGWRCVLWAILGDLEHFGVTLGLENAGSLTPCFCCRANKSNVPWTDFRKNAAWMRTIWSNSEWQRRPGKHVLFSVPSFCHSKLMPDIMHTKHLGTDQLFYGSVLKLLTHGILPRSPEKNLETVWEAIKDEYTVLRIVQQHGCLHVSVCIHLKKYNSWMSFGLHLITIKGSWDIATISEYEVGHVRYIW